MSTCHLNIAREYADTPHEAVQCSHCDKVHRWDYHHGKDLYVSLCGHHVKGDTYIFARSDGGDVTCQSCLKAWDDLYPPTRARSYFLHGQIFPFDSRPTWWETDKQQPIFSFNLKKWLETGIG